MPSFPQLFFWLLLLDFLVSVPFLWQTRTHLHWLSPGEQPFPAGEWSLGLSKGTFFRITPLSHLASGLIKWESMENNAPRFSWAAGARGTWAFLFVSVPQAWRWQSLEVHVVQIKGNAKKEVISHFSYSTGRQLWMKAQLASSKRLKEKITFSLHVRSEHKGQQMLVTRDKKNKLQTTSVARSW